VLIALVAKRILWLARVIRCRRYLDRAVFWLFDQANNDIAACGTIGIEPSEKADPLVYVGGKDASELFFLESLLGACGPRQSACQCDE
jgi:hypothetical protein